MNIDQNKVNNDWLLFICRACGLIYDEEAGDPDSGLAPGTRFEDIPDDWECPLCGVTKSDFELFQRPVIDVDQQLAMQHVASREAGVIIIGAGTAGWSAAESLRALNSSMPITLVTACGGDVYHKPQLSVAISRGLDTETLVKETGPEAAARLGVRLMTKTYVVGVSPSIKQVRTTRGTLSYTKLVLAQGAKPSLPDNLPCEYLLRVNDLSGWSRLHQKITSVKKNITIIGAGMVGCELAEDLSRAGHKVILISRSETPLPKLLPEIIGVRLLASLKSLGVDYRENEQIKSVRKNQTGRFSLQLQSGCEFDADHIIAATGLVADPRIARLAQLAFKNGIVVHPDSLQTSDANIYALGDCISIHGQPCRFIEPIKHQAKAIAEHMCGNNNHIYQHVAPVIRLKTSSCPIVLHGQPQPLGDWSVIKDNDLETVLEQRVAGHIVATLNLHSAPLKETA